MNIIKLEEYGILPGRDITAAMKELFEKYRENTVFVFAEGDYFLSPREEMRYPYVLSNTDASEYKVLGLWLRNMKNCELRGNGARLWCAGQMQPITLDGCEQITVSNLVLDWEKPLVAEGSVVGFSDRWIDLRIDPQAFPHRFRDNWLEFDTGAGEWYPLGRGSCIQYDSVNLCVRRDSGDRFRPERIQERGNSVYRFYAGTEDPVDTAIGNIFVLRHNSRKHAGIFMEACRDITVEDVTVHSCGGLGCLSQFCHNVRFQRVHFVPNQKKNRRITCGRDDGMHITSNTGSVVITECSFIGLMDDPINVHGCSVKVDRRMGERALRCAFQHIQARGFRLWAKPGDVLALLDRRTMQPLSRGTVLAYRLEDPEHFTVEFREALPPELQTALDSGAELALENLTNTPEFLCTYNRFGSCRARGLLVSTPRRTRIEGNCFESSGSAILIPGDCNYWYESGACHDLVIRRNVFGSRCNTSSYQFCEAIISIAPIVPQPDAEKPFHDHIRIEENTFDVGKSRAIYAFSCGDLTIRNNLLFANQAEYDPEKSGAIALEFCNGVQIEHNILTGIPGEAASNRVHTQNSLGVRVEE